MTPPEAALEIATRTLAALRLLGLKSAHYPAIGGKPLTPTLLIYWTNPSAGGIVRRFPEQEWTPVYTGQLLIAPFRADDGDLSAKLALLDNMIVPLADAWDPSSNRDNYLLGGAGTCAFLPISAPDGQLAQAITRNNEVYLGATLTWQASLTRAAGS